LSYTPFQFSVIFPVYKGDSSQFLQEALASLAQQSLPATEIVVVQDGPIPRSLERIIESWQLKLKSLNWVKLSVNQGLSAALNAGIKAARYEWLARMDADDICLPKRFEIQVDYLKKHPEIDILGSWITEFENDVNQLAATRKLPETHREILDYARWRCPFNHMTVMYKKSALENLGGYKNYGAVGDDYELWARFLMKGYKTANIQETLVWARMGEDFFSNRRRGLKYFKNELKEINDLYRVGLLNPFHYLFHFTVKAIVRLSPPFLVRLIYKGIRKTS
jgi:glycosyltransferase involved in cell wall biosynthesis